MDTAFEMERVHMLRTAPRPDEHRLPRSQAPLAPSPRPSRPGGPVWFGPATAPILGWLHAPPGPAGGAAVLCPPLFGEHGSSHAAHRDLARRLTAAGLAVVRFDYPGTGDSGPLPEGADLAECWLDAIDHAVALARRSEGGPVGLVGMRMGAVIAALAAQRREDIDALVLWDPCDSGRAFLRRQQSLHLLHYGPSEDGMVEVPGAALDERTAAALRTLRMPRTPVARRTLLLVRPDGATPPPTNGATGDGATGTGISGDSASGDAGIERATLPPGEQEALLEVDPTFRRMPTGGIERVVHWLPGALAGRSGGGPGGPPGAGRSGQPASPAGAGRAAPLRPAVRGGQAVVPLPGGTGTSVIERVRWLGPAGLFAVESVPADPGVALRRPVVVLLPQANARHTGAGTLWVSLARRWASAGFRCLRVDLSGLGESPARPGGAEDVIRLPEAFDDVADVVRAVADDPRDVVLVGLCSSGYQALEGAVAHDLGGVLAVNPILRFVPPETFGGGPMSSRRKICVTRPRWMTALRERLPDAVGRLAARVRAGLEGGRRAEQRLAWQQEVVRRGVRVYCLCSPVEGRPLVGAFGSALQTARSGGRFEVEMVEDLDHALLRAKDRAMVAGRLTEQLERLAAGW